jgi:putative ABC transport system permease protein
MFTLTVKELFARKLRLLTTAFAVLLGVAFMAGTIVFTDTVGATFDSALADANRGVDAYVRVHSAIHLNYGQPGPRLDATLADKVASVDSVAGVALRINGYAQVVDRTGKPVGDVSKNPAFATNWVTIDVLNPYHLAGGHAPANDNEIVIDKASADKAGYRPGDTATVLTQAEPRQFTISGIARFGAADSPAGASAVLFTDRTAAELLTAPGQAHALAITARSGVSQTALAASVQAVVGGDVEVITGKELIAEEQETLASVFAGFNTSMLLFALVAVFVGAFIINNTFSITVAQRTRQMAMLRAIGASGRQVKRSVLIEATTIGVMASAAGLASGIGVAAGLRKLMNAFGLDIPDGPTVIAPKAMILSFLIGLTVTVVSAWLPARRAARISPLAALREVNIDGSATSRRRAVIGAVFTTVGGGVVAAGLAAKHMSRLGLGALGVFIGVAVLGPVLARPFSRLLGIPLRLRKVSGELATRNAMRNPKRTARTAASLMIGVALVGFITIFAASAKSSIAGSLATDFTGTHIVQVGGGDDAGAGVSPQLADDLRATPDVDAVAEARLTPAVVDGEPDMTLYAFDARAIGSVFNLGDVQGDLATMGSNGIAVSAKHAAEKHWTIGSTVAVTLPTGERTLTIAAIYSRSTDWLSSQFVDLAVFRATIGDGLDTKVFVSGNEQAIRKAAAPYAAAEVLNKKAFLHRVNGQIDTVLGLFYAMLTLAVVIALLGIANTMALSIVERTQELGLLRAVGMSRRQVRSVVRWESIIIAVFGTGLGLTVGAFFGWAIVRAMADNGIDTLTIPVGSLAAVATIAAFAGMLAAVLPARRAAHLDILQALATS